MGDITFDKYSNILYSGCLVVQLFVYIICEIAWLSKNEMLKKYSILNEYHKK